MALPKAALCFPPKCFGSTFACEGSQLATLARELERLAGPLEWWVADIEPSVGASPGGLGLDGADRCGATSEFATWAEQVDQFLSGVFMAVRPGTSRAGLRRQPSAEDDPWVDMADEVFDIRAFDTSYLDLAASDGAAAASLLNRFGATPYPLPRQQ